MGEKAIIRKGDPTSHNGVVLEGFIDNICMGKPIAGVGHKVHCPQCKGDFPIVAGALNFQIMGVTIAVDGMETSCGAKLIATQHTDFVEAGSPAGSGPGKFSGKSESSSATGAATATAIAMAATTTPSTDGKTGQFNEKFRLLDEKTGDPMCNMEYAIVRANGQVEHGMTDDDGNTHKISNTDDAEAVEIYL